MNNPSFPVTLILHQHPQQTHYDWLLWNPQKAQAAHPCETFQLLYPPNRWSSIKRFTAQKISDHREHYLKYQGPISQHRGYVTPIDQGQYQIIQWTPTQIQIHIQLFEFQGQISFAKQKQCPSSTHWLVNCEKNNFS